MLIRSRVCVLIPGVTWLTPTDGGAHWPEPLPACEPCDLSLAEARAERRKLLPQLLARAQEVSGITRHTNRGLITGLRLRFQFRAGLMTTLTRFAETEQAACSRLQIRLSMLPNGGPINMEVTGPEGTREMLLSFSGSN
jgi:hypothetical protein